MSRSMRKIDELLRTLISDEITELKDPRLGLVTITAVETSPDLAKATVYFTVIGDAADTNAGLRSAGPRVRSRVAGRVRLRHMPELEFSLDERAEAAFRVAEILSELEQDNGED